VGEGWGPRAAREGEGRANKRDEDLDDAAKQAVRQTIKLLGEIAGLAPAGAYMLCSLAVDFHVTQLVNVNRHIHGMLAQSRLAERSRR